MTKAEWLVAADPSQMIDWLAEQGHVEPLWAFTIACCRRIWQELPGEAFRRVVGHVERIGTRDIEGVLAEASRALSKLERRLRKAADADEESKLNRQTGFGRMVFAFDHEDGASAAHSISCDLQEWAGDAAEERRLQADLLRQSVADPSQPVVQDEE